MTWLYRSLFRVNHHLRHNCVSCSTPFQRHLPAMAMARKGTTLGHHHPVRADSRGASEHAQSRFGSSVAASTEKQQMQHVQDLLDGFRRSQTLFAIVELGIFDCLCDRPLSVDDVAKELTQQSDSVKAKAPLDIHALERLLDAGCSIGVLSYEESTKLYSNTPVSQSLLVTSSPRSVVGYVKHSSRVLYPLWGQLPGAVREGNTRWQAAFGAQAADVFRNLYSSPEDLRQFISAMHGMGLPASEAICSQVSLTSCKHLVDVGGGSGHFAIAAASANPQLRATVLDLPEVLPVTREWMSRQPDHVAARLCVAAGDFFETNIADAVRSSLPAADPIDCVVLSRILHDWDDDKCRKILGNVYDSLSDGGTLVIADMVMADVKPRSPSQVHLQNLNMLVQTEGKERSLKEFRNLVTAAGFDAQSVQHVATGSYLDAVVARKSKAS